MSAADVALATPLGLPAHELTRSPAAYRVGRLADEAQLFLANFEHRVELSLPDTWLPNGRPDLGEPPSWEAGTLAESKYHSFRYERRVGSFHPGHRAKWGAHELCHALQGFAWHRGASMRFHAVAARIAEALPVTLWYFLDEDGLRRCPHHQGPLFNAMCARCDARAAEPREGLLEQAPGDWTRQGLQWLNDELDAAWQSWRTGQLIPHRHATLDLAEDGLAYAAAHGRRLRSPGFAQALEQLYPEGPAQGCFGDLESLIERVKACAQAIAQGAPLTPLVGGRARWAAQDLGFRLAQLREDTDGEAAEALEGLVARLGADPQAHQAVTHAYGELADEYELPAAHELLSVGYALGAHSAPQLEAGLRTALPVACRLLGAELAPTVAAFASADVPQRVPLGHRFAQWCQALPAGVLTYEAALAHAPPADLEALTLAEDGPRWRLSPAARLLRFHSDVPGFVEALGRGPLVGGPTSVVVARDPGGEVWVVAVSEASAELLLAEAALEALPEHEALLTAGALRATE